MYAIYFKMLTILAYVYYGEHFELIKNPKCSDD